MYVLYHKEINKLYNANIQSASAFIQNMLLSAHSLGIGSLWVAGFDRDDIRKQLNVPDEYIIIAKIKFGYYDNVPETPKRKPLSQFVSHNLFGFDDVYPNSYSLKDWTQKQSINYFSDAIYSTDNHITELVKKDLSFQFNNILIKGDSLDVLPYYRKSICNDVFELDKRVADYSKQDANVIYEIKGKYDTILFLERLNYLPEPEKIIRKIYDSLNKDGRLYVSFKYKPSLIYLYHLLFGKGELKPFELLSYNHVKNLFKDFKIEKVKFNHRFILLKLSRED